jgi:hypothetical protein
VGNGWLLHGIDGAPFGRCDQPRAAIFNAFFGPEFKRSLSCDPDIVGDSDNIGDEPCGLDLPLGLSCR